jgi:fumarate reductase flavoprotein subunit
MSVDIDVVVAGAGAAGLAAALAASDGGRSVLVAEAHATFRQGSNTSMSTGMVPAGGSRWQHEAGIDDSPELFLEDILRKTSGKADERLAAALTHVAPRLVEWLADRCGVPLGLVTDFSYPGHSRDRCHAVPDRAGRTLHRHLLDELDRRSDVTLVTPLRLVDVEVVDHRAAVAVLERPDGDVERVSTDAVVLATNGYGANRELVAAHIPEIADGLYHGGDGSHGDALMIGARLGADTGFLDAYQGHGSVAVPHGILLTWATVMHGAVLVNAEGQRFGDETVGYSEFGARVTAQPGRTAWMVFDQRIDQACRSFADYQDILAADAIRWADDVDGVAELTGAPAEALERTLSAAVATAEGSAQDAFGRTRWEAPLEPPYAVVRVTGALFHTQGGLLVDEHARVLRDRQPIPGLYAAGGAAAGISGHGAAGYLAGNGLLSALGLGYLSGQHLTSEVAQR